MFDIFRWSKNKSKDKNTKHQNKTKKIENSLTEKYRPLGRDEQEAVPVLLPPQTNIEPEVLNHLNSEHIQNKRINKSKNGGKFYFDDDNKTNIALNLTSKRVPAPTPLSMRESECCANINAGQRETLDSANASPIDVEKALALSKINEISVANRNCDIRSQSKNSRNELAERQGHELFGNHLLLLKYPEHRFENSKTKLFPVVKEIGVLETTKPTAKPQEQARSLNEVKVRNKTKTHEIFESKRQSWFGLHFLKIKKNLNENQNTTNRKKTDGGSNNFFFLRKSKSNNNAFAETINKPSATAHPVESLLKKPHFEKRLEKRKDFSDDISMARGRNHNRLRNNNHLQQQQQHHQSQSPQDNSHKNEKSVAKALCGNNDNMANTPVNVNEDKPATGMIDTLSILHSAHLETTHDPANKSTNSYQITASNNSNRNAESHCAQLRNSEENTISYSESAPDIREEHLLSKAICAEALIQCKNQNFLKDQPQPKCEQRNTLTLAVERRAVQADLYLKNSPNTNDQLQHMTKNADSEVDIKARDCDISSNATTRETYASNKLNELTECDRDRWLRSAEEDVETSVMGQTNGKQEATRITRASTPREFRESVISDNRSDIQTANLESNLVIPTITVVDYSHNTFGNNTKGTQKVSSEFKGEEPEITDSIPTIDVEDEIEDQIIDSSYIRLSRVALDDVPEQEESEDYDNKENAHSVLSTSFPDSGIGLDSLASRLGSPPQVVRPKSSGHLSEQNTDSTNPSKSSATYFSKRASSLPMSPSASSHRMPFIRDGYSTDCDDSLIQCDDYDFASEDNGSRYQSNFTTNERLVCIESISLPDVVVESTANLSNGAHPSLFQSSFGSSEHHVHINGTTGNNMENVNFVPIHIEASNENKVAQKRYSIDDNGINGHRGKSTIKITSEEDENFCMEYGKNKGSQKDNHTIEKLKCDLVSQESRYNAQLEDAQQKTLSLQAKVNEMQELIDSLEKDLAVKTWNVEKLQAELNAAHKDDEFVRKKLKLLEEEKTNLRHKYCENEEELQRKYDELEQKYKELEEKYTTTQLLASNLQTQLAGAQSDAQECREQMYEMREEMEEHTRLLKNALENSEAERKIGQDKWQKEFEMLRTHNQDREESLMTDCEWQLRQMQRQCKDKIDKSEYCRREAIDRAELLECAAQERLKEMQQLRLFEAEAKSLRGLTSEQEHSISTLTDQLESLKADLQRATENLEAQIEAVRRIKYQCDNKIYDKDRELIQRIDYVRNEAASFWENKLYTEMTRLKSELESVFIDERREALNKLQAEHIEELRALTTRYTANEKELRAEIAELQERLDHKSSEFLELREKSDSALLQTRMHLDKADRDYQNAMSREEEKREALEESLREEFEAEKVEMEEKFCERIGQVKDEFSRELQMSTQEMKVLHKKELAQQKEKLLAEKDEVMQDLVERHRLKLAAAEDLKKNIELRHQRDLKDLKAAYDAEKVSLDKRDISNANEIEQLHRKCRCLTNLFEEMRVRYERRDPRPEDLREISELRSRCESHEHDLYLLTDRLREMQMQMAELQQHGDNISNSPKKTSAKAVKKPPPKTIPTNCNVIYEENEERDSSPPAAVLHTQESDGDEEEDDYENAFEDVTTQATKFKINSQDNNKNRSDLINEDDGHMITAV